MTAAERTDLDVAVTQLVSLMVDDPAAVVLMSSLTGADAVKLELKVADADVGKVIGRDGRTARALRVILYAIGKSCGARISLDIMRPGF